MGASIAKQVNFERMGNEYVFSDNRGVTRGPLLLIRNRGHVPEPTIVVSSLSLTQAKRIYGFEEAPPKLSVLAFMFETICTPEWL